jgi:hypothetical protein
VKRHAPYSLIAGQVGGLRAQELVRGGHDADAPEVLRSLSLSCLGPSSLRAPECSMTVRQAGGNSRRRARAGCFKLVWIKHAEGPLLQLLLVHLVINGSSLGIGKQQVVAMMADCSEKRALTWG